MGWGHLGHYMLEFPQGLSQGLLGGLCRKQPLCLWAEPAGQIQLLQRTHFTGNPHVTDALPSGRPLLCLVFLFHDRRKECKGTRQRLQRHTIILKGMEDSKEQRKGPFDALAASAAHGCLLPVYHTRTEKAGEQRDRSSHRLEARRCTRVSFMGVYTDLVSCEASVWADAPVA